MLLLNGGLKKVSLSQSDFPKRLDCMAKDWNDLVERTFHILETLDSQSQ